MAEIREIPLSEAKKHPACFLYVWASDSFLSQIDRKYAEIIYRKRLNENKLIFLSAEKAGITVDAYAQGIYDAFKEMYGVSPTEALNILAEGGEVAGKNWKKGVYGIGSVSRVNTFKDSNIKVDSKTGHFTINGNEIDPNSYRYEAGYGRNDYKIYYLDEKSGKTYCSIYNRTMKRYYSDSYSDKDGNQFLPLGMAIGGADGSSIWGNVIENIFNVIWNWIMKLFGGSSDSEKLTDKNTIPSQSEDGFTYTESGSLLLFAAAGGLLLAGGLAKSSKGKKKGK